MRALPVFRGKGVYRQAPQADLLTVGKNFAEGSGALLVSKLSRKSSLRCPASVSVHNNGNVPKALIRLYLILHRLSLLSRKLKFGAETDRPESLYCHDLVFFLGGYRFYILYVFVGKILD